MVKRLIYVVATLLVVLLIAASLMAQADKAQYIGAKKCKMCHMTKKIGDQWNIWLKSPHAKAYATLASEESKAIAKKLGIAENPQESAKCLKCHVTGHGIAATKKAATYAIDEGVTCEACHGAGSLYNPMGVMKALATGKQDAKAVGFIKGDEKNCLTCHNQESPTYKPFNYKEAYAKIAHPVPAAQ